MVSTCRAVGEEGGLEEGGLALSEACQECLSVDASPVGGQA